MEMTRTDRLRKLASFIRALEDRGIYKFRIMSFITDLGYRSLYSSQGILV